MIERIKKTVKNLFASRMFVLIFAFCVIFSILIGRVFYLQIVKGQYYLDNFNLLILKTRDIEGTRGNIYDRNGNLLAYNDLAYSVIIEDNITGPDRNKRLNEILDTVLKMVESNGDSVVSSFGIVLNSANEYQYTTNDPTLRLRFIADVYGQSYTDKLTEEQKNATPDDIMNFLCTDPLYGYGIDQENLPKDYVLKMVNMRYAIRLNSFQQYIPTTLATDVSDETVAVIMENMDKLEGVDIAEDSMRRYVDSQYFASVIGYTGQISKEEYESMPKDQQKKYDLTDTIGKSGLEKTLESVLRGEKGMKQYNVDAVGKIRDVVKEIEPEAGNDVYLTIDKQLQIDAYNLLEEKLAGIILNKMRNVMNYEPSAESNTKNIIIPVDDVYNAFIANRIIDDGHFDSIDAGPVEKEVYKIFTEQKEVIIDKIIDYAKNPDAPAFKDLPKDMQAYLSYIADSVLYKNTGILMWDKIDKNDEVYNSWRNEETINIYEYLNYALSKNWIDSSALSKLTSNQKYSDSQENYDAIVSFLETYLEKDAEFDKLIYKYLIKTGYIKGTQICAIVYEQGVLPMDEALYNGLKDGSVDSYEWVFRKIQNLEITPGQLALEPCTGSVVVSDPNSGEVLACVSYPGFDNNRLANTMDSKYYNQLVTGLSRPFYNNATQERTAPGSTFKPISAAAGLTEGVIDEDTQVTCLGEFTEITPSPRCWVYPEGHGTLDVEGAIENSCNVFFYTVGYELAKEKIEDPEKAVDNTDSKEDVVDEGTDDVVDEDIDSDADNKLKKDKFEYNDSLGVERLAKYAKLFGLDEKSGIEIPESEPHISDEYSVLSAIGQGTHNYTVSQLNRYTATIANKGTLYDLTLLKKTADPDGKTIKKFEPVISNKINELSPSTWTHIHNGMNRMIKATPSFANVGVDMAGKTGTAQQSKIHPDHGLFIGFAPFDEPEIAVTVRIANGYTSAYAAEVGRDVVRSYFHTGEKSDYIFGHAADLGIYTGVGD